MSKYYNIGKALKVLRIKAGLKLRDVEEITGIKFQQISTWELNKYEPQLDKIYILVKAYGGTMTEFFELAKGV